MPVLFGLMFGRLFAQMAFSRAVVTLAMWAGVVFVGVQVGTANISPAGGMVMGVAAPIALLGWALWHPARSRAKLWLLDGIYLWLRLGLVFCVVMTGLALVAAGARLGQWIVMAWPYAASGGVIWGAQRALAAWLLRSHLRAGDGSMIPD